MKSENHFKRSKESMMIKDFIVKYLYERSNLPTYEKIYQICQRITFNEETKDCLRMIRKVLKNFILKMISRFSRLNLNDVGESLYKFEKHWNESKCLFGKIFHPIISQRLNTDEG